MTLDYPLGHFFRVLHRYWKIELAQRVIDHKRRVVIVVNVPVIYSLLLEGLVGTAWTTRARSETSTGTYTRRRAAETASAASVRVSARLPFRVPGKKTTV